MNLGSHGSQVHVDAATSIPTSARGLTFGSVLCFDPDDRTAKLTSTTLSLAGYEVSVVATADQARELLDAGDFQLAIVDGCKAIEDAAWVVDAVERINAARADGEVQTKVIVLASADNPEPFEAARRHACLKRPFATPRLLQLVRHVAPSRARTSGPVTLAGESLTKLLPDVGGYELICELARGGMGTVYLGRKSGGAGFSRLYALKVLHPHLADQTRFVDMLLDEARLASRLHDPNVAAVVDVGRETIGHYIVMEYVEGPSLRQLADLCPTDRPADKLLPLFAEVLEGLHAAHMLEDDDGQPLNLVHRDVSPDNILVGADGHARLTDFGVAKARARLSQTRDGSLKGKLAYLAPELLLDNEAIDPRSDIFAAGAVMWTLLTGETLFRGGSEVLTVRNVLEKDIPKPSTVGCKPPACLDAIVLKALQRDPNKRFESAAEMAEEIRRVGRDNNLFASPSKIGAWVKSAFEEELTRRRERLRSAQDLTSSGEHASTSGSRATSPGTVDQTEPSNFTLRPDGGVVITAVTPEPKKTRAGLLLGLGAVVAATAIAGLLFVRANREPESTENVVGAPSEAPAAEVSSQDAATKPAKPQAQVENSEAKAPKDPPAGEASS